MVKVVNKTYTKMAGVYIGRGTPLGNPYHIGKDGTREEVIAKYEIWLRKQLKKPYSTQSLAMDVLAAIMQHGDLVLICHCKPLPCHGDIIKKILEENYV